jgi:hypothetical protein
MSWCRKLDKSFYAFKIFCKESLLWQTVIHNSKERKRALKIDMLAEINYIHDSRNNCAYVLPNNFKLCMFTENHLLIWQSILYMISTFWLCHWGMILPTALWLQATYVCTKNDLRIWQSILSMMSTFCLCHWGMILPTAYWLQATYVCTKNDLRIWQSILSMISTC